MASPLLERAKIQAQVLVPVLRAFRDALGAERANSIAWRALAEWRKQVTREMHAGFEGTPLERWRAGVEAGMPQIGDAVDIEMQTMTAEQVDFDITGCRFAEFFRALGEPELGFALLCSMDETSAEEIGGDQVRFTRTNTIMQGGSRCDFRYALKRRGAL
jgi:L-2-amino-thiazoline-4-carboxylic acid hydrolase-like protein